MEWVRVILSWAGAYLLGSIPAGMIWGWIARRIDIRQARQRAHRRHECLAVGRVHSRAADRSHGWVERRGSNLDRACPGA